MGSTLAVCTVGLLLAGWPVRTGHGTPPGPTASPPPPSPGAPAGANAPAPADANGAARDDDPFVAFAAVNPLFVRSSDGTRYEVARSRRRCFQAQVFPTRKGENEYRIFCLGGSTVWGRPYAAQTSFTTWLEFNLNLAEPARRWRVVNCGGISYASYRLVPLLKEVLGYRPDMIILYTGQNEFLEARQYPPAGGGPHEKSLLKADVEAMLDYKGGQAKYHRDEAWRRGVIEHYRYSVQRMVRMSRDARVKMLLMNPVCNLRDCPPFKSQHRDGLSPEQLQRWTALCREAEAQDWRPTRAVELLRQAVAIDDQHADLHYRLARLLDGMEDYAAARQEYVRAKELDICPVRIVEPMNEAILRIAREQRVPLVDVRKLIEKASVGGIPGDVHLSDHVHPRIAVHRSIADLLIDEMARQGVVCPRPGWKQQQDKQAYEHLASLGYLYFEDGLLRLDAVRGWAAGLVTVPPPEPKPAP